MQMQINFQYQCYLLYQLILTTLALLTIAIHAIQPLLTLPKSKTKQRIMSSLLMILTLHYTKATNNQIFTIPRLGENFGDTFYLQQFVRYSSFVGHTGWKVFTYFNPSPLPPPKKTLDVEPRVSYFFSNQAHDSNTLSSIIQPSCTRKHKKIPR